MRSWDLERFVMRLDGETLGLDADTVAQRLLGSVLREIHFHARCRYWQFTPTYTSAFMDRLAMWLSNGGLSTDDQRTMLQSVLHLQFVDRDDLMALYRAAFVGPIHRWLIDQLGLTFETNVEDFDRALNASVSETWFCSVTDSMDIAQFCHVNHIVGADYRPPWRVLSRFGDARKICSYLEKENLKRVVILEDFVGSGTQSCGPVYHAAKLLGSTVPVLFTPLIASQVGVDAVTAKRSEYPDLSFEPVFTLPLAVQLREQPSEVEPLLFTKLRETVGRTFALVRQAGPLESEPLEHPFGFMNVGALLVLYTNCPNNTIPLFWHLAPEWAPLFPRISRS